MPLDDKILRSPDMSENAIQGQPDVVESSLWQMINSMSMWVQVCALDSTILMVNRAATEISGYVAKEMAGQKWPYPWVSGQWFPDEQANYDIIAWWPTLVRFSDQTNTSFEVACVDRHGQSKSLTVSLRLVSGAGASSNGLMIARDIKEQKAQETELAQAQKIQAVSQLAFGVAQTSTTTWR